MSYAGIKPYITYRPRFKGQLILITNIAADVPNLFILLEANLYYNVSGS